MNAFFAVLSGLYIFGIFFLANSPVLSQISILNPFSLLHIPVYGILTILLILALNHRQGSNSNARFVLTAFIAVGIGILDEIHQSFIPTREASLTDIFLDALGVSLALFLCRLGHPLLAFRSHRRPPKKVRISCADGSYTKMERREL